MKCFSVLFVCAYKQIEINVVVENAKMNGETAITG